MLHSLSLDVMFAACGPSREKVKAATAEAVPMALSNRVIPTTEAEENASAGAGMMLRMPVFRASAAYHWSDPEPFVCETNFKECTKHDLHKLGVVMRHYAIDAIAEADEKDALLAQMNANEDGTEASFQRYANADANEMNRVQVAFPLGIQVYNPLDAKKMFVKFALLDEGLHLADLYNLTRASKSMHMYITPGTFKQHRNEFGDSFADRTFHAVLLSMRVVQVTNTTPVTWDVRLQVPNMKPVGSNFVVHSDPIGVRTACPGAARELLGSDGTDAGLLYVSVPPNHAGALAPELSHIVKLKQGAFEHPDASRWHTVSSVDEVVEQAVAQLSKSDPQLADLLVLDEPDADVPTASTFAEWVITHHVPELKRASEMLDKPSRFGSLHYGNEGDEDEKKFFVVHKDAFRRVVQHYFDLYDPHQVAVNQHAWRLELKPEHTDNGMLNFARQSESELRQYHRTGISQKLAQVSVTVEIVTLPWMGPQRLHERQKQRIAAIDAEYNAYARNCQMAGRAASERHAKSMQSLKAPAKKEEDSKVSNGWDALGEDYAAAAMSQGKAKVSNGWGASSSYARKSDDW